MNADESQKTRERETVYYMEIKLKMPRGKRVRQKATTGDFVTFYPEFIIRCSGVFQELVSSHQ